jgi:hypothetical protein
LPVLPGASTDQAMRVYGAALAAYAVVALILALRRRRRLAALAVGLAT